MLTIRGGILEGQAMSGEAVEELATLPPADVLRGQVLGAITAPLYAIVGLFTAPLQDLHGLIDARIEQLGGDSEEAEARRGAGRRGERGARAEEEPVGEPSRRSRRRRRSAADEETADEETTEAAEEPAEAEPEEES